MNPEQKLSGLHPLIYEQEKYKCQSQNRSIGFKWFALNTISGIISIRHSRSSFIFSLSHSILLINNTQIITYIEVLIHRKLSLWFKFRNQSFEVWRIDRCGNRENNTFVWRYKAVNEKSMTQHIMKNIMFLCEALHYKHLWMFELHHVQITS